ncbi:MAG: hypothetical protein ACJ0NO_04675 [Flavobacteriaceae bacterium]|mgnify:FL=1|tara:strand:+ start:1023 stop:1709 length:687 start_codon:yes stop_codon:yes gene_type:complete
MRKLILTVFLFSTFFVNAQYCIFFDFEAKEPEMVVSTLKGMMETGWGKNIQGTKSLFAYQFNGTNKATHSVQFCFPDEKAFASFFNSWAMSVDAQLFGEKLGKFSESVSQSLNTPVWFKNDWANDNAFMLYQMEVSDPGLYLKEFKKFTQKISKKLGFENNSYGLAYPIIGKTAEFTHFVWVGSPDIESALTRTKQMFSDPLFAEFSKNVSGIRKVVNTTLSVRLMDF